MDRRCRHDAWSVLRVVGRSSGVAFDAISVARTSFFSVLLAARLASRTLRICGAVNQRVYRVVDLTPGKNLSLRYRLRTLLILLAILPPLLWIGWAKYAVWKAEQERERLRTVQVPDGGTVLFGGLPLDSSELVGISGATNHSGPGWLTPRPFLETRIKPPEARE